jgi:hypothetical protein
MSDVQQPGVHALHLQTALLGDLQLFAAVAVLLGTSDAQSYA